MQFFPLLIPRPGSQPPGIGQQTALGVVWSFEVQSPNDFVFAIGTFPFERFVGCPVSSCRKALKHGLLAFHIFWMLPLPVKSLLAVAASRGTQG